MAKDMRKFYSKLNDAKHDDKNFVNAHKLAKWCLESDMEEETKIKASPTETVSSTWCRKKAEYIPDIRKTMCDWLIDIWLTLHWRRDFQKRCAKRGANFLPEVVAWAREANAWSKGHSLTNGCTNTTLVFENQIKVQKDKKTRWRIPKIYLECAKAFPR